MSKSKLADRVEEIRDLFRAGASKRAIAQRYGVDESSVRRLLAKPENGGETYLLPNDDAVSFLSEIEQPITLRGATALGSDLHVPLFDSSFFNQALADWKRAGLEQLLFAGDFWHLDHLSRFDYKQESANLTRELRVGNYAMKTALDRFETVVLIYGNHDARFLKLLGYKVTYAEAQRMLFNELNDDERSRLKISGRDFALVEAGEQTFRVCHPKDYSSVPCANARKLAAKYQQHVICGHSHHTGIVPSTCGNFIAAELGGFYLYDATDYVQRTTSHAKWTKGYGGIEDDGYFWLQSEVWGTRR